MEKKTDISKAGKTDIGKLKSLSVQYRIDKKGNVCFYNPSCDEIPLSSDERDFLKEVVPILKKADKIDVKSHYCGRLYAQINNKRYFYYYFGIMGYED